jgi:hypothetical protein
MAKTENALAEVAALMKTARVVSREALLRSHGAERRTMATKLGVTMLDEALALLVVHAGLCARHLGEVVSVRLVAAGVADKMEEDCADEPGEAASN